MTNILSPHPALTRGFVECVEALPVPEPRVLTSEGYQIGIRNGARPHLAARNFHRALESLGLAWSSE